jgi:hypothetical protein
MRIKLAIATTLAALFVQAPMAQALITATTYPYTNAAAVALEDMSSGTTQLVAASSDDGNSALANIGFDFWIDGVRVTQFSANANGVMKLGSPVITGTNFTNALAAVANAPKLAPYWDDLCTGTNGRVHFKVLGSAPNRKLVVEWQNVQVTRGAGCAGVGNGTFQAWLFETSGVIEYVYGALPLGAVADGGFSVGLQAGVATNFASVTVAAGTVSYAAANNTQATAVTAGTAEIFTPVVLTAPSGLNFTGTTAIASTLNWTDASTGEVGFAIYRSLDGGTTYSFLTQTAANAVSFTDSTLSPGTTYFYRVYAVSEGALAGPDQNSVTTNAAGNISALAGGGLWSATGTWAGGIVPGAGDNVTIVDGATVTIDTAALAWTVTVGQGASGILEFEQTTARALTVGSNVTVAAGGTLRSNAAGTTTTHNLSVGGSLANGGTLDLSTNADTAGAILTFTGAANATFSGAGATTDIRQISMNKGTTPASVLQVTTSNFTHRGVTTDVVGGWLVMTNGTIRLSGSFTGTHRVFASAAYIIPVSAGFWLDNPNYTVVGQAGGTGCVNNGLLRISQGIFNIGVGGGDGMGGGTGAAFIIEGGTVNATRLDPQNAVSYTQSAGVVNISPTIGNTRSNFGSFELFSAASSFDMTGGTINLIQAATGGTPIDFQVLSAIVNASGTLNVGTAATVTNFNFRLRGNTPNLVIDNTTNPKTGTFTAQTLIRGNTTISTGSSLVLNGFLVAPIGPTFTNNGTLNGTTAASRLYFFGTSAQTYQGTGVVTAPLVSIDIDNAAGLTLDPAVSQIVTRRVILFTGGLTNANKLTLGNGDATAGVVQIGNTTTPTAAGSFDVAPVFNLGAGGQTISYLRTAASRVTGPEINPGRILNTMTFDDNAVGRTLTVSGGDLTMNSAATALTLTNGRVVTGANTLILSNGTGAVVRTNGYVDGNFRKAFAAAAVKNFEVGTANGFSPVNVNVTAGTFPADFTVAAVESSAPNIQPVANALTRYWSLTGTGLTADLTFNYLDPTDIPVTATEANFVLYRHDSAGPAGYTNLGGVINTGANTAVLTGVTNFGAPGFNEWTLAEPSATPVELISFEVE